MSRPPGDRDVSIGYSRGDRSPRTIFRRGSNGSGILFAVFLIGVGVLLFLGNVGVLPLQDVWIYWPAFPLVAGIARLMNAQRPSSRVTGVLMIVFGSLFLLLNLGWIHIHLRGNAWPFSLLLIGVGVAALIKVLESAHGKSAGVASAQAEPSREEPFGGRRPSDILTDLTIFGSLKRKSDSLAFKGGRLVSVFGNIELDLRRAQIALADRTAVLEVVAVLGAISIKVPQSWRVHVTGTSILGNFEDNTVPPNTAAEAPTLVITGMAVLGTAEIED